MTTARAVARDVLVRVDGGAYSNLVLPAALRRTDLDARDRAFATDLVYGTLRARRRVDAVLAPHTRRPLDDVDPPVRALLRLGAYQLLSGVAPHAAVGETVAAAPGRARGYVNAVLRAVAAAPPPAPASFAEALSYPDWIVARLTADLGEPDARAALAAQNEAPLVWLRPNRARTDPDDLAAELAAGGATVTRGGLVPDAVAVRGAGDPAALPAVREGRATPQDQASQTVVAMVEAQPGDRVLDVAAAPGGKATGLGERVGAGVVVAVDRHPGRLGQVGPAARRLGLPAVRPVLADGRALPVAPATIDRALVDAPCSGLGVLRRRPEARWRTEAPAAALTELQAALVLAAAAAVRPGGRLVYSVCTLTAAETVGVAARVLDALGGAVRVVEPPGPPWRPAGPGALLLPQDADTDGMFVLVVERVDAPVR
ncbi:MAG TPA: transcription antitermination factor NusB [Acidimicrobiia bacterium]|nr:transcription antitermination factor NusB [Acidimicrobiia bacterium]